MSETDVVRLQERTFARQTAFLPRRRGESRRRIVEILEVMAVPWLDEFRGEHSGGRGLNRKVEGARRALHIYTLRRDGEGFTNTYI